MDRVSKATLVEPPSLWLTYQDISKTFSDIVKKTESGDLVYIHDSGHGARVRTAFENLKGRHRIDEALVPLDIEVFSNSNQGRYVRDVELACWLQALVGKGLRTSLFVDNCHSGRSTRAKGDIMVRGTGIVGHTLLSTDRRASIWASIHVIVHETEPCLCKGATPFLPPDAHPRRHG